MATIVRRRRKTCGSCQLMRIQGVVCHELGCPESWKDQHKDCKWCGRPFHPKVRGQQTCSSRCRHFYYGPY
jgi:hypothetical protein